MTTAVGQLLVDSHSHTGFSRVAARNKKYFQLTVSAVSLADFGVTPNPKPLETVGGKYAVRYTPG